MKMDFWTGFSIAIVVSIAFSIGYHGGYYNGLSKRPPIEKPIEFQFKPDRVCAYKYKDNAIVLRHCLDFIGD